MRQQKKARIATLISEITHLLPNCTEHMYSPIMRDIDSIFKPQSKTFSIQLLKCVVHHWFFLKLLFFFTLQKLPKSVTTTKKREKKL